jgi:hypothetical protein
VAATDCETGTDVSKMLDVASPMATSSQDVSKSGDHADTATTTPESTVSTNVEGPVNQTPSSSASSAPSNLYQLNPVSDSVLDGTYGDLSSTTSSSSPPSSNADYGPAMVDNHLEPSSSNAAQLDQLNPSATSTSSRLSQAADGAQLASPNSGNFGAMTQYGAFIGSDPQLARTPNLVSAFDDIFQNGVLSGNGDRTMSQPVQAVSLQANTMMNTLESNLNTPQNVADIEPGGLGPIGSILHAGILPGNGPLAPSIQGVSSHANAMVDSLGSNLILHNGAVNDISLASGSILPVGILSGNGDHAPSIQGVSTQTNAMVNTLGPNLNTPQTSDLDSILPSKLSGDGLAPSIQGVSSHANAMVDTLGSNLILHNGAVNDISLASGSVLPVGILSGNGDHAPSIQGVSTQANAMVNTLGPNLNIPQTSDLDTFLASALSGNGDPAFSNQGVSTQANAMVNTLESNLDIPQNVAAIEPGGLDRIGSILHAGILPGNGPLAPSIQGVSPQANTLVNTLGPNLNIPQTGGLQSLLPASMLSGNGDLAPSIPGVSTQANAMVNTLESNLNIPHNDAVNDISLALGSILPDDILSGNGDLSVQGVSTQANAMVNTLGSNLNIPHNGAVNSNPLPSGLDGFGPIGVSSQANTMVNTLGSNLNIHQNGVVNNNPLASGLDAMGSIGTDIVGISTHPVQAASNTISDPLRQSSFTNNFLPDSLNTPRIEANTVTTSTGNCICNL